MTGSSKKSTSIATSVGKKFVLKPKTIRSKKGSVKTIRKSFKTAKTVLDPKYQINMLTKNFKKMYIPKSIESKGIVVSSRGNIMEIQISKELMSQLKDIYAMTEEKQWEFAGSISCEIDPLSRNYVKFGKPTTQTSRMRTSVSISGADLTFKITYHSHPLPKPPFSYITYMSHPSETDFNAYINSYPKNQGNIIIEQQGIYLIDLIESTYTSPNKPKPSEVYKYFKELLKVGKVDAFQVQNNEIIIFSVNPESWKKFINGHVDRNMKLKYNISVRFYMYSDLPTITLKNVKPLGPQ